MIPGLLVVWIHYMLAASALLVVAGSAGYVMVSRFHVVQKVVCMGLGKALRNVAEGGEEGGEGYSLHFNVLSGLIEGKRVRLKKTLMDCMYGVGTQVTHVYVEKFSILLPSWRCPLMIRIESPKVSLAQMWTPLSPSMEANLLFQPEKILSEKKKKLLMLVDEVLWGASSKQPSSSHSRGWVGGFLEKVKDMALHRTLQFVTQYVEVDICNLVVDYVQQGEPGPRPSYCKYTGADGARLKIRKISLRPISTRSCPPRPGSSQKEEGNGLGGATTEDDMAEPSSWRQALAALPKLFITVDDYNKVSMTRLAVTGISLELLTFPETWEENFMDFQSEGHVGKYLFPKYAHILNAKQGTKKTKPKSHSESLQMLDDLDVEREVHEMLHQWEFSVILQIIPPGIKSKTIFDYFNEKFVSQGYHDDDHDEDDGIRQSNPDAKEDEIDAADEAEYESEMEAAADEGSQGLVEHHPNNRYTIKVEMQIKALILDANVASINALQRIIGRQSLISRYGAFWATRPKVPVQSNEIAWWHHAGGVVLSSVKKLVQHQEPLEKIEERRASRLAYQPLYISKHSRNDMFKDPEQGWFQRSTITALDEIALRDLQIMEEQLNLEEIAHFRMSSAIKYNRILASDPALRKFTAAKIDFIIAHGGIGGEEISRDSFLHLDRDRKKASLINLDFIAVCPKISIALDTRRYETELVHKDIPYLVCSLKNLGAAINIHNKGVIKVAALELGPAMERTGKVVHKVLSSPSLLCRRVCKAADFTRYSVTGAVRSEALNSQNPNFMSVEVKPRGSVLGLLVGESPPNGLTSADSTGGWIPEGADVAIKVAVIGAKFTEFRADDSTKTRILLNLLNCIVHPPTKCRRWTQPAQEQTSPIASKRKSQYPCLSEVCPSIDELVENSCAVYRVPICARRSPSSLQIELSCPGIAVQVPYTYNYAIRGNEVPIRDDHSGILLDKEEIMRSRILFDSLYMFTVTVQHIHLRMEYENFDRYFDEGAIQRFEARAVIDAFSYLSEEQRSKIAHGLAPSRFVFDGTSREFKQVASGVKEMRDKMREVEITSMAKVWAYPEDIPFISRGLKERNVDADFLMGTKRHRRTTSQIGSPEPVENSIPDTKWQFPGNYPMPIVPFLKSEGMVVSMANRFTGMPQIPGDSALSVGMLNRGIQLWFSPVQLAQFTCIQDRITSIIKNAVEAFKPEKEEEIEVAEGSSNVHEMTRQSNTSLSIKVNVQEISMLWMVGTWLTNVDKARKKPLKNWGLTVRKNEPAFIWGRWFAPLYSASISNTSFCFKMRGQNAVRMGIEVRALIVRDLQLSDMAKHAFVLRPLPARTRRVYSDIVAIRREILGVVEPPPERFLWRYSVSRLMLKRAVTIDNTDELKLLPSLSGWVDIAGPQVRIMYKHGDSLSYAASRSENASLSVEVGQMLAYLRIKQHASIVSFLSQMLQVRETTSHAESNHKSIGKSTKSSGYQSGLRMDIKVMGIDITCRVQSQDLFSLKLQQGQVQFDRKMVSKYSNPGDIRLHVSTVVEKMTLIDLRVRFVLHKIEWCTKYEMIIAANNTLQAISEHQHVISPNASLPCCSLDLIYTAQVDSTKYAPQLILNIQNPRIVVLFRFIRDVMEGISILTSSFSYGSSTKQQDTGKWSQLEEKPLNVIVQLQNIGIVLPTGRTTRTIFSSRIDELVLALPGAALPKLILEENDLPSLDELVEESIVCSKTYLHTNFSQKVHKTRHRDQTEENRVDSESDSNKANQDESSPSKAEDSSANHFKQEHEVERKSKKRRQKKKGNFESLAGVLLFEQGYDPQNSNQDAGVLRIPEEGKDGVLHDEDRTQDNILARPGAMAEKVLGVAGHALRGFVPARREKTVQTEISEESKEPILLELPPEEEQEEDDEFETETDLAICVSNFYIASGILVQIPAYMNEKENSFSSEHLLRSTTYGASVSQAYEIIETETALHNINLAMVMFQNKGRYSFQQLHMSLSPLNIRMSAPVFTALMDFVSGNLGDYIHPNGVHPNPLEEIRYNEKMKFGPSPEASTTFRMTLAVPNLRCVMHAHPREWMPEEPRFAYTTSSEVEELSPFFYVEVSNAVMSLVTLDTADTYMNICSTGLDLQDLRVGYRLSEVSASLEGRYFSDPEKLHLSLDSPISESPHISVARRFSSRYRPSHTRDDSVSTAESKSYAEELTNECGFSAYIPVVDFPQIPEFSNMIGPEAATYKLITPLDELHAPLHGSHKLGPQNGVKLEVSIGILHDSTMAVEVSLDQSLIHWPYFHDSSLFMSLANVFNVGTAEDRFGGDHPELPPHPKQDVTPWMYINVLVTSSEIFVPVIEAELTSRMVAELWEGDKSNGKTLKQRNTFQKCADMILAALLVHSSDTGVFSIEDRGLSLDTSLFRFCYAIGGDGEIVMKADLSDVSAVIRDPNARIHSIIQPLSASLQLQMQTPEAAHRQEVKRLNDAATVIQTAWKVYQIKRAVLKKLKGVDSPSLAPYMWESRSIKESKSQWRVVDKLAMDVASPRTRKILDQYYSNPEKLTSSEYHYHQSLSVQSIKINVGVFTCRVAFSHVTFWNSALDTVNIIVLEKSKSSDDLDLSIPKQDVPEAPFRPSGLKLGASFEKISVVLCNDRPETFGAPDVLNAWVADGSASIDMASLVPDRSPNAVGQISMTLNCSFLNSGTSKWESMLDPWPVRAEFLDYNSSNFVSDRKLNVWLSSERSMNATFNPASLMSIGDALALFKSFEPRIDDSDGAPNMLTTKGALESCLLDTPGSVSRAPQKYLIQNQTGLKLYYWSEEGQNRAARSPVMSLEPEASETLKVTPATKRITLLNFTSAASGAERLGSVINLHFEGNWMPIHDVPINVVGKYKYSMLSPADNTTVPVLVDVILVGRTKIITVHSGIWVSNGIERPISFRLHVPTTSLVPPGILASNKQRKESGMDVDSDMIIGPLNPGDGTYLPLTAALGGLLFLRPDKYEEATRDVIRLSVNVEDLINQQGYLTCESDEMIYQDASALHVTMEVIPSRVLSEFQSFKHMEVIAPGTVQRALKPLEVTISIQPTMIFTNSLPYDINVVLWQIGVASLIHEPDSQQSESGEKGLQENQGFLEMLSPRISLASQSKTDPSKGRYLSFIVSSGEKQSVYADVRQDILMHASLEEVNMRTVKWSLCNLSRSGRTDIKDISLKIPKMFPLRLLDVGFPLPVDTKFIPHYLTRLKEGASHLRSVHAQFRREAKKAVNASDIQLAVGRLKTIAKRRSKKSGTAFPITAPPQTTRRAAATSARPLPAGHSRPPASPPYENMKPLGVTGVKKKREKWYSSILRRKKHASWETPQHLGSSENNGEHFSTPGTSNTSKREEPKSYTKHRPPPLEIESPFDDTVQTAIQEDPQDQSKVRAPPMLNVMMHNSFLQTDGMRGSVSRLTFFVPFWLNNRTGVDLFYKDLETPSHMFGFSLPWDPVEVFVPGTSLTEALDRKAGSRRMIGTDSFIEESNYKIVMLNKQEEFSLGLAHIESRKYSQPVGIKTVGNKGTIELRGPPLERTPINESGSSFVGEERIGSLESHLQQIEEPDLDQEPILQDLSEALESVRHDEDAQVDTGSSSVYKSFSAQEAIGAMKNVEKLNDSKKSEGPGLLRNSRRGKRHLNLRSFEFSIDVSAAPRKSIFQHTKLVTLKPKYIIENQTGILLDIKQIGTVDPEDSVTEEEGYRRFARTLPSGTRAPVYWDDFELPREITIRPRLEGEQPDEWHWSGGFPIPDTEWYFGLRIRHKHGYRRYINIPVNVTVGSSGSVQVTLKSPESVPPYRIENLCKDVHLYFVQVPLVFRQLGKNFVDSLQPNEVMPYAWDEPTMLTKLRVQAKIAGRQESRVADYALDDLGNQPMLLLPTQDGERKEEKTAKRLYRTLSSDMPAELKQRLVSLLAAEFSKKVYVTVYADGPTRVLRFSDEKNVSSVEREHVVLDLAFRLKQVESQLREVNLQFAKLSGMPGGYYTDIDLYGRFPSVQDEQKEEEEYGNATAKPSRKIPLPKATQMLVKQASRHVLLHSFKNDEELQAEGQYLDGIELNPKPERNVHFDGDVLTPSEETKGKNEIFLDEASSSKEVSKKSLDGTSLYSMSSRKESKDWGHLETLDSTPTTSRRPATFKTGAGNLTITRRQELLKNLVDGDMVLLVGGDLNVTVVQARDLYGNARITHAFARVRVRDAVPPPEGEPRAKQTSVIWQSLDPIWDEQLLFKDVCVASELVVEVWDLGGTRSTKQMNALTSNPSEVIKSCRFLGRAEVPLVDTLDMPAMTPIWYPLMRRTAADEISGRIQMRFHWDITTRGLMSIKLSAFESVLAQRREILAALQPVHSLDAVSWSKPNPDTFATSGDAVVRKSGSKLVMPTIGMEMFRTRGEDSSSSLSFNPSEESITVMNRHAQDHRQRHLVVTVLEARGLNPRSGVVVALSDNELPNPVVRLNLSGYPPYTVPPCSHTLNPRWPANQRHIFRGVDPINAEISVTLFDQRGGLRRRLVPLGKGIVHASNLKGERPSYIWVPLFGATKRQKNLEHMSAQGVIPELQVFLRVQWLKSVERGSRTKIEIDLAGAGLMVVGGLQDELFNLTVERMGLCGSISNQERIVVGSVHSIQLDNQTLNAVEPVVLAPDIGLRTTDEDRPLMKFSLIQSFAGNVVNAQNQESLVTVEGCSKVAKQVQANGNGLSKIDSHGIRSYKKFELEVDPLHLQTDEVFMESLLSFLSSLPSADVWQDASWKEQQHRLLTAQFGPREVEMLAINATMEPRQTTKGSSEESYNPAQYHSSLTWVMRKEEKDMEALHGQSDLSSWFFIESAEIGKIVINVSIALSSRLLQAGQSFAQDSDEFSRALGASGYQLVNVSNVNISFGRWQIGNDPSFKGKRTSNGFLSQKALVNNLTRHYTRESLKEAHKVLGGAGPAVASVPLAVLWASGSTVVLLHKVSMGKAGPLGIVQQLFYVPFMTISMFFSGFSRMLAAGMAVMPPDRTHGDDETVRRLVKRPSNALDALTEGPKELVLGFTHAFQGFVFDPIAGWHGNNVPGFVIGLGKGIIGLPVRPVIGIFEFSSDVSGALAMASLGRTGIVGRTLRRVRAPGASWDEPTDLQESEHEAPISSLQAAWQRALPEFFPELADESVKQVLNVRSNRVILITTNHVAYLRANHYRDHSVYKSKWLIPVAEIQNIRGDPDTRKIIINHVHKYDLKVLGVWPVQKRKGLRCDTRSIFEKTILRLTKVQQAVQSGTLLDDARKRFNPSTIQDLTTFSSPYSSRQAHN